MSILFSHTFSRITSKFSDPSFYQSEARPPSSLLSLVSIHVPFSSQHLTCKKFSPFPSSKISLFQIHFYLLFLPTLIWWTWLFPIVPKVLPLTPAKRNSRMFTWACMPDRGLLVGSFTCTVFSPIISCPPPHAVGEKTDQKRKINLH